MKKRLLAFSLIIVLLLTLSPQLLPTANAASKTYVDVVEEATATNYGGYGALYDIDGNGIDELIMLHFKDSEYEGLPYTVYSVYTMSDNSLICLVDADILGFEVGGCNHEVSVVELDGSVYLSVEIYHGMEFSLEGEEIDSGEFYLYSVKNTTYTKELEAEYKCYYPYGYGGTMDYTKSTATINGKKQSYSVLEDTIEKMEDIVVIDLYAFNAKNCMPLDELLTYLASLAPSITTQPKTQKVKAGTNATFKVAAIGDGLKYQWQFRKTSDGAWKNSSATGCKTSKLTVAASTGKHGYQFRCKITDSIGNVVYTNAANMYVLGVKTQPATQKVEAGETATFKVSATGYKKTYQWQFRKTSDGTWKNSSSTGCKTSKLTVDATTGKHGYQFRCKITDSAGNVVYTKAANLYVLGIKTQPTSQTVDVGETAIFTVSATGHQKTYQWQFRKTSDGTWKNSSSTGCKTSKLSVAATAGKNGYQFRCKITDSAGNVIYSKAATLKVTS